MHLKKPVIVIYVIQFILVLILLVLAILLYQDQIRLSMSQSQYHKSYLLADELRQSSDDLTRMARAYVVTGNTEFEREYWTILDIRDGVVPRPLDYNRIYWDFYVAGGKAPRGNGEAISLNTLMVREGFTQAELEKLSISQLRSDVLVNTERIAMNAVKGLFDDGSGNFTVKGNPDPEMAVRIMNDESYYKAKADIMRPIDEFYTMFQKRTAGLVEKYEKTSRHLMSGIIAVLAGLIGMFIISFVMIPRKSN